MNPSPCYPTSSTQRGYILPLVLVLLVMLMVSSAGFFHRSTRDTQLSGASRDYDQARLLAESGMNLVLGRITNLASASAVASNATLPCIAPASMPAVNDLNCNGLLDANEAKPASLTPPLPLPLGYQYFASNTPGAGITENEPRIIQMVADGEARSSGTALPTQAVPIRAGNSYLRVNDLFIDGTRHPLLLTQSQNGLSFSYRRWSDETAPEKAAVWLEVTRDPDPTRAGWYDLYIESVAEIGPAKAYIQRFVGAYTDMLGAQVIAPLSEASNHP